MNASRHYTCKGKKVMRALILRGISNFRENRNPLELVDLTEPGGITGTVLFINISDKLSLKRTVLFICESIRMLSATRGGL